MVLTTGAYDYLKNYLIVFSLHFCKISMCSRIITFNYTHKNAMSHLINNIQLFQHFKTFFITTLENEIRLCLFYCFLMAVIVGLCLPLSCYKQWSCTKVILPSFKLIHFNLQQCWEFLMLISHESVSLKDSRSLIVKRINVSFLQLHP